MVDSDELPSAPGPAVDPAHGYPLGHLGHLSEQEVKATEGFKVLLRERGYYLPGPPPSHDDQTLIRFLRARRWNLEDAYKQFKDTEDWRISTLLDVLYDTIDLDAYESCRRLYPQWTGRRDRRGIPLYLFEIKHLDSKTVANYEKTADDTYSKAHADGTTPPKLLRLFALYENLTRFVQPLCTEMADRPHPQTPITLSTNIVDISGVSLRQFWNLKSHMQSASLLATAHYPETLDRIFIIGAPGFFTTVWGWIKRWFDPVTVSKIFILSSAEVLPVLTSFVDPTNIPKKYGGELEFNWLDQPNLDPAIRAAASWENGFDAFPVGPLYFRPISDDRLECIAMGSIDQKERQIRVCTLPRSFKGVYASNQPVERGAAVPAASTVEGDGETVEPPAAGATTESITPPPAEKPVVAPAAAVDGASGKEKAADPVDVDAIPASVQNLAITEAEKAESSDGDGVPEKLAAESMPPRDAQTVGS